MAHRGPADDDYDDDDSVPFNVADLEDSDDLHHNQNQNNANNFDAEANPSPLPVASGALFSTMSGNNENPIRLFGSQLLHDSFVVTLCIYNATVVALNCQRLSFIVNA